MNFLPAVAFLAAGLLSLPAASSAQYMRIRTDNPTDATRLRTTGTTILTITLDTNHDKNGSTQTCNSHTTANCGAPIVSQPLNMLSYTLALKATGGTVTWGTFTPADAAYTDLSPQIQSSTEVEINKYRPPGTFTPAGLSTIGTLPVTVASGNPSIAVQNGASSIDPFGFGTSFGTLCDGFQFPNAYVIGDPADPCGLVSGFAGDWFDFDGVLSTGDGPPPVLNHAPVLAQPSEMTVDERVTLDQVLNATDPDGDALTFSLISGPTFATVSTTSAVTGNVHLAPSLSDSGTYSATVRATDTGVLSDDKTFTITVNDVTQPTNHPPVLAQPSNMTVNEGATQDQVLNATDPDGDPLTFSLVSGPTFATVSTTSAGTGTATGNIHLAPGFSDAGTYAATVRATDTGGLGDSKTFTITVTNVNRPPVLNPVANMTVNEGATADQAISASDPDGEPVDFVYAGPSYMTVTTTSSGPGTVTGNIHLAPGFSDAGTASAEIEARSSEAIVEVFRITVNNVNQAPVLAQPSDMTVAEGATADQGLSATDADGTPLTFALLAGPTYSTVTTISPGTGSATGNLHLAPGFGDAGTATDSVFVSDGTVSIGRTLTVTVNNVNRFPSLDHVSNMTTDEGVTADQVITGRDPDGDALTFEKVSGPLFMSVLTTNPTSGSIHLAPFLGMAGEYPAAVSAVDPSHAAMTQGFLITVRPRTSNRPPTLVQPIDLTMNEGEVADQTVSATDPDETPIIFSLVSGPTFMALTTLNSVHANIHITPGFADAGTYPATVRASDGSLSDEKSFTTTVNNLNRPPVLNPVSHMTVVQGATADQAISGSDADGDSLHFEAFPGSPTFMTVTTINGTSGNIHLAPSFSDSPTSYSSGVSAVDPSNASMTSGFQITVVRASENTPPTLAPPSDMTVDEGATANQIITATDPDDQSITFSKVAGPTSMSVAPIDSRHANIHLAPGFSDAATYQATVRASDGIATDDKSFAITVNNARPVVTAPEIATVEELAELSVTVTASDPDNDPITLIADLSALPVENDAVFTTNVLNTEGRLVWHPIKGDIGTYQVTFSAIAPDTGRAVTRIRVVPEGTKAVGDLAWTPAVGDTGVFTVIFSAADADSQIGTAQTQITVVPRPAARFGNSSMARNTPQRIQRGPIVSVIATVTVTAGDALLITVSAVSPDRGPIVSLAADVSGLPPTNPPTFTVSFDPVVTAPPSVDAAGGVPVAFQVSAGDPDGEAILSLTADLSAFPAGTAHFAATPDNTAGTFEWMPQPADIRSQPYRVVFTASNALTVSDTTMITVRTQNHAPTAGTGGPYSGFVNAPVPFDASTSSDPDGDRLSYAWTFGDLAKGTGVTVNHTYLAPGTFTVSLTVTDIGTPAMTGTASTTATINQEVSARVFRLRTSPIQVQGANGTHCFQIEPIARNFTLTDLVLNSIIMKYGTAQVAAITGKTVIGSDTDHNGIPELQACWRASSMATLFAAAPLGITTVTVTVRGNLISGGRFTGDITFRIKKDEAGQHATIAPNPLNPSSTLSFTTSKPGSVKVDMFDVQGRLVRTIVNESLTAAGYHEAMIDGHGQRGEVLPSGVYFVRGVTVDETFRISLTILK